MVCMIIDMVDQTNRYRYVGDYRPSLYTYMIIDMQICRFLLTSLYTYGFADDYRYGMFVY